jgi:hypothetical protein
VATEVPSSFLFFTLKTRLSFVLETELGMTELLNGVWVGNAASGCLAAAVFKGSGGLAVRFITAIILMLPLTLMQSKIK